MPRRPAMERVALYICLPLLFAVCFATWRLWSHVQTLDRFLAESKEVELGLLNRVRDAVGREELAGKALQQALLERDAARSAAQRSRADAEAAHTEAERQRRAAERLRAQREAELDRMTEALGRIAETDRTPIGMVVQLTEDSLLFEFDRAELRARDREILSRIAGVLLASYGYSVSVYGHTDDQGDAEYNKGLSERRAATVRDYLAEAGIPDAILEARGFGEESPRVPGVTGDARRKNRRVEIAIVDTVVNYGASVAVPGP
ncbi:MAG: OmpA family protein [Bryobacterales bacterium]|nr:OmpA family protein [Bryobacterales bacterium]